MAGSGAAEWEGGVNGERRTDERRERPNGADCRTARIPEQRELPNSANSRTARTPEQRERPNSANARTARTPEQRELPSSATTKAKPKTGAPSRSMRLVLRFS